MSRVCIGTSGYNYPEWRGTFYPEGFPARQMFGYYAERFPAVEINYTFYRMPTLKTTEAWCEQAPAGFQYVLKAPRRITHDKRLVDCADTLEFFQRFGAFPSGVARPVFTPEPPEEEQDPMTALIREMDTILEPISATPGG